MLFGIVQLVVQLQDGPDLLVGLSGEDHLADGTSHSCANLLGSKLAHFVSPQLEFRSNVDRETIVAPHSRVVNNYLQNICNYFASAPPSASPHQR